MSSRALQIRSPSRRLGVVEFAGCLRIVIMSSDACVRYPVSSLSGTEILEAGTLIFHIFLSFVCAGSSR